MTDTNNNDNAKHDGQADSVTRDVMPMATTLQSIIAAMDGQMQDLDKSAARSHKNGDYNWENVCNARILGLLSARRIVLDVLEQST